MRAGSGGGLGRLYGANVDRGRPVPGDGRIAGTEYRAVAGRGADSVSFVVQVPDTFDRARPCVVAAPATGLGGVYSMVGTAGAWGLHRRCAVAYTDKGMGPAFDDLRSGTVMALRRYDRTAHREGRRGAFDAGLDRRRAGPLRRRAPVSRGVQDGALPHRSAGHLGARRTALGAARARRPEPRRARRRAPAAATPRPPPRSWPPVSPMAAARPSPRARTTVRGSSTPSSPPNRR